MAKYKVYVTDKSFPAYDHLVDKLKKHDADMIFASANNEDTFITEAADADVIFNSFALVTKKFIEKLTKCKMIIRTGIGVNTIDVDAATAKGIMVSYVPDYCRDEVADHSAALILAAVRKIRFLDKRVREGIWNSVEAGYVLKLNGKVLGICGFGAIAQRVAKRMQAFGMEILAYDPYLEDEIFKINKVKRAKEIDEIFTSADVISLNLPLTEETKYIINKDSIEKMKNNVFIINTARGPLVNENDLIKALKSGKIAGAGIDVFEEEPIQPDNPLCKLENVVLTPHAAYYSVESLPELQKKSIEEVIRVLNGEFPLNWLNKAELNK